MSFYLAISSNIKKRKYKDVFYFKGDSLYLLHDKESRFFSKVSYYLEHTIIGDVSYDRIVGYTKDCAKQIIEYLTFEELDCVEVMLPCINPFYLDFMLSVFARHLETHNASIGLLVEDIDIFIDYSETIEKYDITHNIDVGVVIYNAKPHPKTTNSKVVLITAPIEEKGIRNGTQNRPTLFMPKMSIGSGLFVEQSFNDKLIKYLNESGKTNTEVYQSGGITRQVF